MKRRTRALVAGGFVLASLAALGLALAGVPWLDPRARPALAVVVDRAAGVPATARDEVLARLRREAMAAGWGAVDTVNAGTADLAATLDAALGLHAREPFGGAVLLADTREAGSEVAKALGAAREAGLPVAWVPVATPASDARIASVSAPARVLAGQPWRIALRADTASADGLRFRVALRGTGEDVEVPPVDAGRDGRAEIQVVVPAPGARRVDVTLEDAATGAPRDSVTGAAAIDVLARGAVLIVQGTPGPYAASLRDGGWPVETIAARELDARAAALDAYRAVVLEDVAASDASPRAWSALDRAVREDGTGLVVLGGPRAFARGGYCGTVLEALLPVTAEAAALDAPASVVFAIDKSGSMDEGAGGVNRFRLAREAVIESARALGPRDRLGVIAFDVAPRVIVPTGPAAPDVLARDWAIGPGGGTRLAPALEAAAEALEREPAGKRFLVLVTDGFADDGPAANLRERLARAGIETIALAVGPDADVKALARIVGEAGTVRRVGEAARLPLAMRESLDRVRARVERGPVAALPRDPLPFASPATWPAVEAYAVTRAKPGASIAVASAKGDPLVALGLSGRGRVVALPAGLGGWAPRWLAMKDWPAFAGGLVAWAGGFGGGGVTMAGIHETPVGLRVSADVRQGTQWSLPAETTVTVRSLAGATRTREADAVAPGRVAADIPGRVAGLAEVRLDSPQGSARALHLSRAPSDEEANAMLATWRRDGLVRDWDAKAMLTAVPAAGDRPGDRSLVALALALFLAAVGVERGAGLRRALVPTGGSR